jgi:hypothetical protein
VTNRNASSASRGQSLARDASEATSAESRPTTATRPRQEPHKRGKERSISRPQPRTRMLPPQHNQLVTQDEQLNVLSNLRTSTANDQPQHRYEHQVDKRKDHHRYSQTQAATAIRTGDRAFGTLHPGQTTATYVLTTADVGHELRVRIIASNTGGPGSSVSAPTAKVSPAPSSTTRTFVTRGKPLMHDDRKSDGRRVRRSSRTSPASPGAEAVEGRRPAKGNAASEPRPGHSAGAM